MDEDKDLDVLLAALRATGLEADAPIWSEPGTDWSAYHMLVVKSPWDYALRSAEFLDWLNHAATQAPIRNHPEIIRWNIDKLYLRELAARGIPVPDFHLATTAAEVAQAVAALAPAEHVVVKPTVSAGSKDSGLFHRDDPALGHLVERIAAKGKTAMVQRALPSVAAHGERDLLLFNGRFSHAVRKGPILEVGGGLLGGHYREVISPVTPAADEVALAELTMATAREIAVERGLPARDAVPLHARIDIARDVDGAPTVLEAELFEPNYNTPASDGGAQRFAHAVHQQLEWVRN